MSRSDADPGGLLSWPVTGPMVATVLVHPGLWSAALGALRRMAGPRWWRHRPFLPLPHPDWWAFRMVTAYGRSDARPEARDVVSYLRWCRSTASSGGTGARVPGAARGPGHPAGGQSG